jgi:tetratricopeptide (TPR) repeat protein
MVLLDQGEREAGDAQIARARELEPDHLRARLHSMYAAMEAEDLETCVEHGTHAVGIEPEDSRILAARARCLAELGRADEALADLARAEEIEPWATFVLDDMAIAYLALDRPDDAITAVRRALEIDPKFEDGHYDLISALMAKGQHEEAMAAFREFQKVVPEDRIGLANNLSWEFYLAGRYEESLQIVEEWLAAYPEPVDEPNHIANPEGYGFVVDTVAHDYAALGRDEEAVQAFLRAAEISSEELRPMYEERLAALGHKPEPGEAGLEAALRACVATREACKLYPQE